MIRDLYGLLGGILFYTLCERGIVEKRHERLAIIDLNALQAEVTLE